MANPQEPAFNYENVDVLLHPKVYLMKNDNFDIPNFEKVSVN